ncbi:hypothetical protein [Aeromonas encheleia]|uniref:Uncharacterized protein n=1 Tax=Aeromonas encheleia TaxID=73010 RepID=A0AAE9MKC2_9GAMM|nr:hypothetical protein [Aeromonas encheleia]USV59395.1 hypothetical protein NHF51_09775 [Aeromonas encheleia]
MHEFIQLIKSRSDEHGIAFSRIHDLPGSMMSILRQELDSLIRVLYLLSISDLEERNRLMACTVNGDQWKVSTQKGKLVKVTDAQMVEISDKFGGWASSVYRFGCTFIHLSTFHGYNTSNPLTTLSEEERKTILDHMRYYHNGPESDNPTFQELANYFPRVFEKIKNNLECYLELLSEGAPTEDVF